MRSTLKRVFNKQNPGGGGQIDVAESAEGEEAFFTNRRKYHTHTSSRPPRYTDTRRFASSSQRHSNRNYSDHGSSSSKHGQPKVQVKSRVTKMNPMQRDGRRSHCFECGAYDHWSPECPIKKERINNGQYNGNQKTIRRVVYHGEHHEAPRSSHYDDYEEPYYEETTDYEEDSSDEEAYVVLMNTDIRGVTNITSRHAIIDTACSKGVVGHEWFKGFHQDLPEEFSDSHILP